MQKCLQPISASSQKQIYNFSELFFLFFFLLCVLHTVDEEMKCSLFCFGRVAFGKEKKNMREQQFTSPGHFISFHFYFKIVTSTADCMLYLSIFPASFGVVLLPCSGCDYPERGCYGFIMYWKEMSVLPVIHINSVLMKPGFMSNCFQIQTTFLT